MKVSGFTFIKNAVKFDYPIVEAIKSVLPLCDEFILALGNSDDSTEELIKTIQSPKLKIFNTVWDDTLREGGKVLASETDKALSHVSKDSTWCIYIQGDECMHEDDYDTINRAMKLYENNDKVEGLVFNYLHFYGTYDYISDSFSRYRREVRIIKNNKSITSWGDAQGFRKNGEKINVKLIDATIYHYGMVKPPKLQQDRFKYMHQLWHDEHTVKKMTGEADDFDYYNNERLIKFNGKHPAAIEGRVKRLSWELGYDPTLLPLKLKIKIKLYIYKFLGIRIGEYKNYKTL
jgi:hypothetical protein